MALTLLFAESLSLYRSLATSKFTHFLYNFFITPKNYLNKFPYYHLLAPSVYINGNVCVAFEGMRIESALFAWRVAANNNTFSDGAEDETPAIIMK